MSRPKYTVNQIIEKCKEYSELKITIIISQIFSEHKYNHDLYFSALKFYGLFRGINHDDPHGATGVAFSNQKDFWEAPAEKTSLGRFNAGGQPMLYCSNNLSTAIIEAQPVEGKYITMVYYESTVDPDAFSEPFDLRLAIIGKKYLSSQLSLRARFGPSVASDLPKAAMHFDKFLDKLCCGSVNSDNIQLYKASNVVGQILMNGDPASNKNKNMHGLIYPSVFRSLNSYNVVLKPKQARKVFGVKKLQTFYVMTNDAKQIVLKQVRSGIRYPSGMEEDRDAINWRDTNKNVTVIVRKRDGKISIDV